MNTKTILTVVITIMACVIIFLRYDGSKNTTPETILESEIPVSNIEESERISNSAPRVSNSSFPNEGTHSGQDNTEEMQSQASSTNDAHTHNWVNCSKCNGKGVGFFGCEGYSYCRECRGKKIVCSICGERDDRPQPCIACNDSKRCGFCKGMGFTYDEFVGEVIIVKGQGSVPVCEISKIFS
ncbi:MAG: hypothetical protein RSA66_09180 [Muribaculaceae bacterium]